MTPIGHTLIGLAVGIGSMPDDFQKKKKWIHLLSFICLANIPDIPLPYWGHSQYWFSHSFFVNMVFYAITVFFLYKLLKRFYYSVQLWKIIFWIGIAWFSHLLLDSFYNHAFGVMIWWPFSEKSLNLPIPWLSVQTDPLWIITKSNLKIWGIEFISFIPFVVMAVLIRIIKKLPERGSNPQPTG